MNCSVKLGDNISIIQDLLCVSYLKRYIVYQLTLINAIKACFSDKIYTVSFQVLMTKIDKSGLNRIFKDYWFTK